MGKVISQDDLIACCREIRVNGKKIVFMAGIFELLHPGHVRLLEQARDCGDALVAAVLDDSSVREMLAAASGVETPERQVSGMSELKLRPPKNRSDAESVPRRAGAEFAEKPALRGVQRPVTPGTERAEILAALAAVDYAIEIGIDALPELLAQLRPDVVVEGAEPSSPALLANAATGAGIELVRIPLEPGHSTAGIIERIVQLSGSE